MEVKDEGYPRKKFRGQLCPFGGNWIGETAKADVNTLSTFRREINEEISFDRPQRDSGELRGLGLSGTVLSGPTPLTGEVTTEDIHSLSMVREAIVNSAVPFGDFLNTMDFADEGSPSDKRTFLGSYFSVALGEEIWKILVDLHGKFGNLSSEALSVVTSLSKIVSGGVKTAFVHDLVFQQFFNDQGFYRAANDLPIVPDTKSVSVGSPLLTYADYLARYEVAKSPF